MHIVFRVDASYQIGSGHVMRSLILADTLRTKGAEVLFICKALEGNLIQYIESRAFTVKTIPVRSDSDAQETIRLLQNLPCVDWLIVDHYSLDVQWEQQMSPNVAHIMVIDDLVNRVHNCDLLLDQSYLGSDYSSYEEKVPSACRLCIGPKWFLLRPEFEQESENTRIRESKVGRILVSFGGVDERNHTMQSLLVIEENVPREVHIDVVVSQQNPDKDAIALYCQQHDNLDCHIDVNNMAELMKNADLAIGAAGLTALERVYMRLPALVTPIAENHVLMIQDLEGLGLVKSYSSQQQLKELLLEAVENGVWHLTNIVENGTAMLCEMLYEISANDGVGRCS